jgi:phosphatidylglycerophosphatase A
MGSFGAIPLYLLVAPAGRPGVAAAAIAVTAVGIWAASIVANELGTEDPQVVVVDEVAGTLVTMLPMRHASWPAIGAGVLLFRLFDIIKPWPIRNLERLPGGWGVVLDDIGAGLLAAAVMQGLRAAGALP